MYNVSIALQRNSYAKHVRMALSSQWKAQSSQVTYRVTSITLHSEQVYPNDPNDLDPKIYQAFYADEPPQREAMDEYPLRLDLYASYR